MLCQQDGLGGLGSEARLDLSRAVSGPGHLRLASETADFRNTKAVKKWVLLEAAFRAF